jgi:exopolysaccharide production protein ExoZ
MILEQAQSETWRKTGMTKAQSIPSGGKLTDSIKARPTVHSVQLLRAVAALLVVFFHGQQAFASHISQPAFPVETYLFGFGAVGVHVFFVISGFIMVFTSRFEDGFDSRKFFRRRLLRIYPIYWLCAALYVAAHALLALPYELSAAKTVGALMLLPGDAAAIIGPAWTLSFEMFFYLCFGLAMTAGLARGIIVLACAFAVAVCLGLLLPAGGSAWELVTDPLLLEFVAGAIIGWLLVSGRLPRRGGAWFVALALIMFVAGIVLGYDRLPSVVMWGAPSALLVAGVVAWEAGQGSTRWVRQIGLLGDSSYALYLIHILVITLVVQAAMKQPWLAELEPAGAACLVSALAMLAAELLHRKLERPALAWLSPKRALVPRRPTDPAS